MKDIYAPDGVGIKRIERMEEIYDRGFAAVDGLIKAAEVYLSVKKELDELEKYYTDGQWLTDLAVDRAGGLPQDMKRGILSEDAIYDLLTDEYRMVKMLKSITENKKNMICDLHVHSNCSDGSCTPEELISVAMQNGVGAVALCDHNTVSGLERFENAAEGTDVIAVPGVEITAEYGGKEVHILGLFLKKEARVELTEYLKRINVLKRKSNEQTVERLRKAGYGIEYSDVLKFAGEANPNRVHISKALMAKGYVSSTEDAFAKLLNEGGEFYIPAERLNALDVVSFLSMHEAVPVLAHPLLNLTYEELCEFLPKAKSCGLVGVEAYYSLFDEKQTELIKQAAEKFGILLSAGSDFHGVNKTDIDMGSGKNNMHATIELYERLKAVSESRRVK